MRRAVITGLGIVSSIGINQEQVTASLKAGKSGITFSEEFAEKVSTLDYRSNYHKNLMRYKNQ